MKSESPLKSAEERPCWTSLEKRSQQKSKYWLDRWNILGSKDNKKQPKSRRCYFDKLPWAQVLSGKYVEHSDRHGVTNFDVFCACSQQERDSELSKRFQSSSFKLADADSLQKAIENGTRQSEDDKPVIVKIPKPGPHAVPLDFLTAAMGSKISNEHGSKQRKTQQREFADQILESLWKNTSLLHKEGGAFMEFYQWGVKKYGTLARCWKMLDDDCNMRITKTEFLKGCLKREFKGDAKSIFRILDRDKTEHVSFFHFDPVGALDLAELHQWAQNKFGGISQAFKALDRDRNGQLTKKECLRAGKEHGLPNSKGVQTLFEILDADNNTSLSDREVSVMDKWKYPPWLVAVPDHEACNAFKDHLLRRYHHQPIRAWRGALDRKGAMRVSWDTFEGYCRLVPHIQKDILPKIWKALDQNMSGWLSLGEIWPKEAELLETFVQYCKLEYGSVRQAFLQIDSNGNGRLSRHEFQKITRDLDLSEDESDVIFNGLDLHGDGRVEADEVQFLDRWCLEKFNKEEALWHSVADALRQMGAAESQEQEYKEQLALLST